MPTTYIGPANPVSVNLTSLSTSSVTSTGPANITGVSNLTGGIIVGTSISPQTSQHYGNSVVTGTSTVTGAAALNGGLTVTGGTTSDTLNVTAGTTVTGGLTADTITANLTGNCSGSSASFTGSLVGDVTGTQGATVVGHVGGVTAANVATGANLANAATNANTVSTIVKRDASGNFTAGYINASTVDITAGGLNVTGGATTDTLTVTAGASVTGGFDVVGGESCAVLTITGDFSTEGGNLTSSGGINLTNTLTVDELTVTEGVSVGTDDIPAALVVVGPVSLGDTTVPSTVTIYGTITINGSAPESTPPAITAIGGLNSDLVETGVILMTNNMGGGGPSILYNAVNDPPTYDIGATGDGAFDNLYATNVNYTNLVVVSDKNKKRDIHDLDEAYCQEFVRHLRPKRFRFIDGYGHTDKHHMGLLAQDVQDNLYDCFTDPTLLNGSEGYPSPEELSILHPRVENKINEEGEIYEDKTLHLNYMEIMAPLISMCKTMDKRIKVLQDDMKSLQPAAKNVPEQAGDEWRFG